MAELATAGRNRLLNMATHRGMAQVTAVSGHGETKLQVDDTARRVSGHVQGGREALAEIPRIVNPQDNQRKKRRSRQDLLTASSENQSAGYVCNRASNSGDRTRTCDLEVMSLASYQLLHPAVESSIIDPSATLSRDAAEFLTFW